MANRCFEVFLRYLHGQWTSANEARVLLDRYTVCYLSFLFPRSCSVQFCASEERKRHLHFSVYLFRCLRRFFVSLKTSGDGCQVSGRVSGMVSFYCFTEKTYERAHIVIPSFPTELEASPAVDFLFSMCVHVYMSVPLVTRCEVYCCSQRCVFVFFSNVMMELIYKPR